MPHPLFPVLCECAPRRRGDSLRPTVPEPIMAEIRRENLEYWRKVTILNERYATSKTCPIPTTLLVLLPICVS